MANPNTRRVGYSSLTWNAAANRYILPSGKFMSGASVRATIDTDIEATGARMVEYGDGLKQAATDFKSGSIDQSTYVEAVKQWRNGLASEIKAMHLGQGAAAAGGFHAMGPQVHGQIGQRLRVQYRYLDNFAVEAASNPDIVLDLDKSRRAFDERVSAYSMASLGTFNLVEYREHKTNGFQSMQNELGPNENHCNKGPRSCIAHHHRGRVSIDDQTYLHPGFRVCGPYDKCGTKYFKSPV